jgi:DNA-binding transcriptional ArsR family regulator
MSDEAASRRVTERLAALREADARLARALEATTAHISSIPETAIDMEPAEAIAAAIAALGEPLPAELLALAAAEEVPTRQELDRGGYGGPEPWSVKASDAVQAAYGAVGEAAGAAASLFATGRLMFEGAACDLAVDRMKTYAQVTKALNALLPQVVGWELREEGLACHCICPMCGLGACGCIWASLHNIDLAWGGAGLAEPDEHGIPLRSPPRPGSQLAAAGVHQWDRVVAVDDQAVRAPAELQTTLRRHAIGEEVRLRIEHNSDSREVVVRHTSDLP